MSQALPFPSPPTRLERRRILSDTTIRSLRPPLAGRVDYFDDVTPGLSFRVTPKDVRTWTVFYRDRNGRQKRLTLGRYPAVKLANARELAREVLTFGELAAAYIDGSAKPNKRSWQEDERQINASLLPKWKALPAAEISAEDLLAVLNAKVKGGLRSPRIGCALWFPGFSPLGQSSGSCRRTPTRQSASRSRPRKRRAIVC